MGRPVPRFFAIRSIGKSPVPPSCRAGPLVRLTDTDRGGPGRSRRDRPVLVSQGNTRFGDPAGGPATALPDHTGGTGGLGRSRNTARKTTRQPSTWLPGAGWG